MGKLLLYHGQEHGGGEEWDQNEAQISIMSIAELAVWCSMETAPHYTAIQDVKWWVCLSKGKGRSIPNWKVPL